jgi:hypothetical protein
VEPPQITFTGQVLGPVIGVAVGGASVASGQTVDMGLAPKKLEFTITHIGRAGVLEMTQIATTGNFPLSQQPTVSLSPQGTATITVLAQCVAFGPQTGSLTITSNDGDAPVFTIPLVSKPYVGAESGVAEDLRHRRGHWMGFCHHPAAECHHRPGQ